MLLNFNNQSGKLNREVLAIFHTSEIYYDKSFINY